MNDRRDHGEQMVQPRYTGIATFMRAPFSEDLSEVDIAMGTFSKAFGVGGGFVAASQAVVDYLRFFARSYFFSASLPPMVVTSVLGCL